MKSVNILYINIIFSAVNWKDNPAGRCMDIYNIVFHFSGCRIGGKRDAVSRKIVGAGVRLSAAQCREMMDGIISDPSGTGAHDHNHRRVVLRCA